MLFTLKKIASHFIDIPVEKRESRYSGQVEVALSQGQYKLSTSNAIYSFGKKYTSFGTAFKAIDIPAIPVKKVLVLGLGLGSVIDLLENHPTIERIVAIDADDIIIELAAKYLQSGLKSKVEFVCDDAEAFVKKNLEEFDLVLFDVFIEDLTPIQFMQPDFFKVLKQSIRKDGLLIFSKIEDSFRSKIENAQFEQKFTLVFPEAFSIDADGNRLFVWVNK